MRSVENLHVCKQIWWIENVQKMIKDLTNRSQDRFLKFGFEMLHKLYSCGS